MKTTRNWKCAACFGQAARFLAQLTFDRCHAACRPVFASRNLLTVLFSLTLWLGATQHCNLEAAGILTPHAESGPENGCCAGTDDGCAADGCESVENGAFRNGSDGATLDVPVFSCCDFLVCLNLDPRPAEVAASSAWLTDFERPLDWVPTWQFVQRAALSPRAPSLA